jgi:F-type H+-transporting ATPase subunit c
MTDQSVIAIVSIAAAALTMAVGAVVAALGVSRIGAAEMDALARQPDEASSITRTLFVSLAMSAACIWCRRVSTASAILRRCVPVCSLSSRCMQGPR